LAKPAAAIVVRPAALPRGAAPARGAEPPGGGSFALGDLEALPDAVFEIATDDLAPLNSSAAAAWLGFSIADRHRLVAQIARQDRARFIFRLEQGEPAQCHEATIVPLADGRQLLFLKDATLEANLRTALLHSRERYKDLVTVSSDFAWETDNEGRFVFVSPKGALGYPVPRLIGLIADELLTEPPDDVRPSPFHARQPVSGVELAMRNCEGATLWLSVAAAPVCDETGAVVGARGVCRDVTELRNSEADLAAVRHRERLLAHVLRVLHDRIDPRGRLASAAEALGRALGAPLCRIWRRTPAGTFELAAEFAEVGGCADAPSINDTTAHGLLARPTAYAQQTNGQIGLWRPQSEAPFGADDIAFIEIIAAQIGIAIEQIDNLDRLERLSRQDGLTGLMNRRAFQDDLRRRIATSDRHGRIGALLYMDLDNFKPLNDQRGHEAGDEALKALARILRDSSRSNDLVARLGGDEFAVWLDETAENGASRKAAALLAAMKQLAPYGLPDTPLALSIGVAMHDPARLETVEDLLARADGAMYAAKRAGKNGFACAPVAREDAP
jgi:diguanylate cyclase (GGDEF)-like protein/PAS domain S-box-containing protein